jgi:hypothetical protein
MLADPITPVRLFGTKGWCDRSSSGHSKAPKTTAQNMPHEERI